MAQKTTVMKYRLIPMGLLVYSVFVDAAAAANDDSEHEDGVVNI